MELRTLDATDQRTLPSLARATGFFSEEEVGIVGELVQHALGDNQDGYHFAVADRDARAIGFACWGLAAQSDAVYDLYWIAVDPHEQGRGIGRTLIAWAEEQVATAGGRLLVAETEGGFKYTATRAFYLAAGYTELGRIPDFYRLGADKVFYGKRLR